MKGKGERKNKKEKKSTEIKNERYQRKENQFKRKELTKERKQYQSKTGDFGKMKMISRKKTR